MITSSLSRGFHAKCDTFECDAHCMLSSNTEDIEEVLIQKNWGVEKVGLEGEEVVRHYCPAHRTATRRFIRGINEPKPTHPADVQLLIAEECDALKEMLLEKNRKYGNAALEPVRIASRASPVEQILVRIDDKLSRLRSMQDDDDEDVWNDLAGYIMLLRVARRMKL